MEEIEKCDCPHFLILFRDSKLQFRALYAYYPDTEEVDKFSITAAVPLIFTISPFFCRCLKFMVLDPDK